MDWKMLSPSPTDRKIWSLSLLNTETEQGQLPAVTNSVTVSFGQNKCKILQVSYDIFQAYLVIEAEYPQLC